MFVTNFVCVPVPVFVTVTAAPATAACCESVTVPEMFPRVSCASAVPETNKSPIIIDNILTETP